MDYFSGLKKAFDNIESEMTRSLVGNNKEEPPVEPHVIEEKSSSKEDTASHSSQGTSASRDDDWDANWEDAPTMKTPPKQKSMSTPRATPSSKSTASRTSGGQDLNTAGETVTADSNASLKNTSSSSASSKLDSMSKEELIKLVRRQFQSTQKAKSKSEELSKEVAELRRQVAEKSQESSSEAATEAEAVVEGLRAEKDAALRELSTLQSTMNTLQQDLTNEKEELQDKVTSLENEVAMRDQQLIECQQRIEEFSRQHKAAVDEGHTLQQQVELLNKSANQDLTNEKEELLGKVTSLENEVAMRDQQLLECQQRIEEVSRQHKAAIDEGTTLQQQVELLNKSADQSLTNEKEELQVKVTSLENEVALRDQQLLECQQRIEELSRQHKAAVDEGHTLQQQVELLNKNVQNEDQLKDELIETTARLSESKQECQELTRRLTDVEHEKTSIQEKLQVERSGTELRMAELESLKQKTHQLESDKEDCVAKCNGMVKEKEGLREMVEILESSKNTLEMEVTSVKELTGKLQAELAETKDLLQKEKEAHSATKQKLGTAEKGVKASSLMDLELADYQRTVQSLETDISSRDAQLLTASQDANKLKETIDSLRNQLEEGGQQRLAMEEKVSKMKGLLVKSKKELAESKKNEEKQEETIQQLKTQLESNQQQMEQTKMESADLLSRLQSMEHDNSFSKETSQKLIRTLEQKVTLLQSELASVQSELADCQKDYNNYKVRAQSVLKQQQRKSTLDDKTDQSDQLQSLVTQLKAELKQKNDNLSAILSEHEELTTEHEHLISRHDKLLGDMEANETKWRQKLQQTEEQCVLKLQQQNDLVEQLRNENILTSTAFKEQLKLAQQDHHKMEDSLRRQLIDKQALLDQFEEDAARKEVGVANANLQERSQGEGMDQSELDSLSTKSDRSSLEQLLNSSRGSVSWSRSDKRSNSQTDHLTELLRECEADCQQLTTQNKVLKEEIRRLERNQEREKDVNDLEYLKNVVLKFIHTSDLERRQLVPVITTLLKLSPKEKEYIMEVTKGNTETPLPDLGTETQSTAAVGTNKGLMSYVHRWTGY